MPRAGHAFEFHQYVAVTEGHAFHDLARLARELQLIVCQAVVKHSLLAEVLQGFLVGDLHLGAFGEFVEIAERHCLMIAALQYSALRARNDR